MKRYLVISIILAICLTLLSACSGGEKATKAEFFTYIVDVDGNAEITGYTGNEAAVVIPSKIDGHTVISIGDEAFEFNTLIVKVIIPDSVKSIGESAFNYCHSLEEISLPDSIVKIKRRTFNECDSLKTLNIPSKITEIPDAMCAGCKKLSKITLPSNIRTIGDSAFSSCSSIKEVVIPNTVTEIGRSAFAGTGISKVTIPASVQTTGTEYINTNEKMYFRFADCPNLKTVVYEQGITAISLDDFQSDKLQSITIPDSVTLIIPGYIDNIEEVHIKRGSHADEYFSNEFVIKRTNTKKVVYD